MAAPSRLIVFDALMLRGLITNDNEIFPDELAAFRVAFEGRRFGTLLTNGILAEYQAESMKAPQFLPLPILNGLRSTGRTVFFDEHQLQRSNIRLAGLPREHQSFIHDAIAGRASYLVTNRQAWMDLSDRTESRYGLQIVAPGGFVQLEG